MHWYQTSSNFDCTHVFAGVISWSVPEKHPPPSSAEPVAAPLAGAAVASHSPRCFW